MTDGSEKLFAVVEIGGGQHPAVRCQPFGPSWTVKGRPVFGPTPRIGAAEQKHDLLDELQRQIGCMNLQDQHDDVDVIEEIQIDVLNVEDNRLKLLIQVKTHRGNIVAPVDAKRGLPMSRVPALRLLSIEESLYVRQEGHELAIVALLELSGVDHELVEQLLPWAVFCGSQQFPVMMDLQPLLERHQLQWPEQNFAKLRNHLCGVPLELAGRPSRFDHCHEPSSRYHRRICAAEAWLSPRLG